MRVTCDELHKLMLSNDADDEASARKVWEHIQKCKVCYDPDSPDEPFADMLTETIALYAFCVCKPQ